MSASPRAAIIIASVTMKGWMRAFAITTPFASPSAVAQPTPAASATRTPRPARLAEAPRRGVHADGLLLPVDERQPARGDHHRERHDEGLDARLRYHHSVRESERGRTEIG